MRLYNSRAVDRVCEKVFAGGVYIGVPCHFFVYLDDVPTMDSPAFAISTYAFGCAGVAVLVGALNESLPRSP
jgi:hypothetical protein